MTSLIVVCCPKCSQKYRLPSDKVGHKARCKCGQQFTITNDQPVDEDTIFGWVLEDEDPSSQSVMGGTGIFENPFTSYSQPQTAKKQIVDVVQAGVRLDHIDEEGAHFEFPSTELNSSAMRESFPKQCISCGGSRDLLAYVILWTDKMKSDDQLRWRDSQFKHIGKLNDLMSYKSANWLDEVQHIDNLHKPFSLPFPFYGCENCMISNEVKTAVYSAQGMDYCQLAIANLEVAAKFFRNNGGKDKKEFVELIKTIEKQKKDDWKTLPSSVRRNIIQWHKMDEDEKFKAFFPDTDFGKAEIGKAGLVLTDKRLCYRKYSSSREFKLTDSAKIFLQNDSQMTNVRITQKGQKDAVLHLNHSYAEKLVSAIKNSGRSWKVSGDLRTI